MSLSFLDHLASRLRVAEDSYLLGRTAQAQEQAHDVIRDLASLTSTSRRLTRTDHSCADGCVCEAAMILLIQCIADAPVAGGGSSDRDSQMSELVSTYYGESRAMPYAVFVVWIQWHLSGQHYEMACRELIAYLDANYATDSRARVDSPKSDGSSAAGLPSADARYQTLLELLLFHTLVPLGAHEEALAFLRKGKRSRARVGSGSSAPLAHKDERISPETKERWMNELLDLQAQGFTHALASARQVTAAESQSSAQAAPAPIAPSSSAAGFRAGLHAMHEATAYTRISQQQPLLLPANLPDSAGLTLPSHSAEEHIESDSSAATLSSASYYSSALLPTDPLLPWMAVFGSTPSSSASAAASSSTGGGGAVSSGGSWSWSAYLVSCFHRLYLALHPWAPRLANMLRGACSWTWARRGLWATLLVLYLAGRVFAALLRFFRLADLPGVRLIVGEIRNFIRIAFISGTGRSLFA